MSQEGKKPVLFPNKVKCHFLYQVRIKKTVILLGYKIISSQDCFFKNYFVMMASRCSVFQSILPVDNFFILSRLNSSLLDRLLIWKEF